MKTAFLALLGILPLATTSWGQSAPQSSGLYRTAADFRHQRLALAADANSANYRLRLHQFPARPYVTVVHGGSTYRMAKDSLFGFRNHHGQAYRFAGHQHYLILNPSEELLLYKQPQPPVGKNQQPAPPQLFFSASAEAPLQPLTRQHLKRAFPNNQAFHDLLDAHFNPGDDLTAMDTFQGTTKVNWLLQRSRALADARQGG